MLNRQLLKVCDELTNLCSSAFRWILLWVHQEEPNLFTYDGRSSQNGVLWSTMVFLAPMKIDELYSSMILSLSIPSIWHKYPNTTRVRLLVKRTTKYLLYVVIRALRLSLAILAHEDKCINPFNSFGYSVHISLIIDGLPWWSQRTWYGCLLGSKALPL